MPAKQDAGFKLYHYRESGEIIDFNFGQNQNA